MLFVPHALLVPTFLTKYSSSFTFMKSPIAAASLAWGRTQGAALAKQRKRSLNLNTFAQNKDCHRHRRRRCSKRNQAFSHSALRRKNWLRLSSNQTRQQKPLTLVHSLLPSLCPQVRWVLYSSSCTEHNCLKIQVKPHCSSAQPYSKSQSAI